MASNDFMKFKTAGDVKAQFRHSEKESRKKQNHSNKDINLDVTDSNVSFENLDYQGLCDKYDKRMDYLDSLQNQNKRRDRVTCFGVETPCPEELPEHLEDEWCKRVYEIECELFGKVNVLDGIVHKDEKHAYIHAETGKECVSRTHLHTYVIPEVDGKLNGKVFSSKARMIQLNNAIQKMSETEFGVRFMDGSQKKSTKSVEKLKNESIEALHRKEMFIEARAQRQWDKELKLDDRELSISRKEKEVDTKATEVENQAKINQARANELDALQTSLNVQEQRLRERDEELQLREREIEKKGKISFRLEILEQYVRENPTKTNFAHAVKDAKQRINETMVTGNKLLESEGKQQPECLENQQ